MTSSGEIHTQAETMAVHITDGVEVSGEMLDGSFGEVDVEIQGLAKMSVADAVVLNSNDAALSTSQTLNVTVSRSRCQAVHSWKHTRVACWLLRHRTPRSA